jgi:hypothetical protein
VIVGVGDPPQTWHLRTQLGLAVLAGGLCSSRSPSMASGMLGNQSLTFDGELFPRLSHL